jgi:hypothetical protein
MKYMYKEIHIKAYKQHYRMIAFVGHALCIKAFYLPTLTPILGTDF